MAESQASIKHKTLEIRNKREGNGEAFGLSCNFSVVLESFKLRAFS